MTSVTLEVAAFADAVQQASRISPTSRGIAWDKLHGILLSVQPGDTYPVVIRTGNLDVYRAEWLSALSCEGEPVAWRVPVASLSGIIRSLPLRQARPVTLQSEGSRLAVSCGRLEATLNLINADTYPLWDVFDPAGLSSAEGLAAACKAVEWAANDGYSEPHSGIHITNRAVMATDRYRAAVMPLEIPHLKGSVTIPCGTITIALREIAIPKIGNPASGSQLMIMPDDWTQIRVATLANQYPIRAMNALPREFDETIAIDREAILDLLNQVAAIEPTDRTARINLFLGNEEIAATAESESFGLIKNVVDIPGRAIHDPLKLRFNKSHIIEALNSIKTPVAYVGYNLGIKQRFVCFTDKTTGYRAWVAVTSDKKGTSSTR